MRETAEFIRFLEKQGIKIRVKEGELVCRAIKNAMTPPIKERIARRKHELIDYLVNNEKMITDELAIAVEGEVYPLSFGQERLVQLISMDARTASGVYQVSMAYHITGNLDIKALEHALHDMQERHVILRTVFPEQNSNRVQIIQAAEEAEFEFHVEPRLFDTEQEALQVLTELANRPIDITHGPLWRTHLFVKEDKQFCLLFTFHHLIFDGWSKHIFLDELSRFYAFHTKNVSVELAQPLPQYPMVACALRQSLGDDVVKDYEQFWRQQVNESCDPLILPFDKSDKYKKENIAKSLEFDIPDELAQSFVAYTRSEKISLGVSLLLAFSAYLYGCRSQENLVICMPFANRTRKELEDGIGYYNNILPLIISTGKCHTIGDLLAECKSIVTSALKYQVLPFQHIASMKEYARIPLTRCLFSFQNTRDKEFHIDELFIKPFEVRKASSDFDMAVNIEFDGNTIRAVIDYNSDIFMEETVAGLQQGFMQAMALISHQGNQLPLQHFIDKNFMSDIHHVKEALIKHSRVKDVEINNRWVDNKQKMLVAYVILWQANDVDLDSLKSFLVEEGIPAYLIPDKWIVAEMDVFPRVDGQVDGEFDDSVLEEYDAQLNAKKHATLLPENDLEKALVDIWEEVLWLEPGTLNTNDDFFDLGGHSMLAVQIIRRVEQYIGHKLPVEVFSSLTNIKKLARLIENSKNTATAIPDSVLPDDIYYGLLAHTAGWKSPRVHKRSLLFTFNEEGKNPPLFWCIHGHQPLKNLAKHLGSNQPLFGMRSGSKVMEPTEANVNKLAAYYVSEIQEVQPTGPYLIGGNCHSGRIAFAIAKQLTELRQEVSLLCLLEQFVPQDYAGRVLQIFGENSHFNPYHFIDNPEYGWRKYYSGDMEVQRIPGAHGQAFNEPYIGELTRVINNAIDRSLPLPASNLDTMPSPENRLPEQAYRASISTENSLEFDHDGVAALQVKIINSSPVDWELPEGGRLELSYRWIYDGGLLGWGERVSLPTVVRMKQAVEVTLPVTLFKGMDRRFYDLEIDLIEDGVTWFKYKGSSPLAINVDLRVSEFTDV